MVTLDASQSHDIERLGLKKYLVKSPNREAWHSIAQAAIKIANGDEELAATVVGKLASGGREDSAAVLGHIKNEDEAFDTLDNQKVDYVFIRLWGPCVILDFKQEQNGGKEDE